MILVDANLLVYASVPASAHHQKARDWLDGRLNGLVPVGLPWASLLAFLRLVTNPRIFERPASVAAAWGQVRAWLDRETVWVPMPGDRHAELLGGLLARPGVRGNLVPGAHLAALAMEHGLALCSADSGFGRFPGLRWLNPLAA